MAEPIGASRAAGDIALQALVFMLIEMVANSYEDPGEIRGKMRAMAEDLADRSTVPDMPQERKAQDRLVREKAKVLIGLLTSGGLGQH
jgi:hypothetical protein